MDAATWNSQKGSDRLKTLLHAAGLSSELAQGSWQSLTKTERTKIQTASRVKVVTTWNSQKGSDKNKRLIRNAGLPSGLNGAPWQSLNKTQHAKIMRAAKGSGWEDESGSEILLPKNNNEKLIIYSIYDIITREGFTFSLRQIINYYLSLKTKPFVILTGISGTGKTKITELFAQAVCKDFNNQYLLLPVRPDWNDDRNLIGYYNPLTKQYQTTPFLDFIMKAAQDPENPYFVCLDEMNLARVEYYFSTFLSAMESGSKDIKLPGYNGDMESKTPIPSNLFFTGTVNMDETTYRFSPKVLDRANTIEFHEIDLLKSREKQDASPGNPELIDLFKMYFLTDEVRNNGTSSEKYQKWETDNWDELTGFLHSINKEALEKQNLHFGYRIRDEILRYMYFAEKLSSDDFTTETALDLQIKQKILPRIKGPESIREALKSLRKIIDKYPQSAEKLDLMIGALDNGYTDFYQ